MTSTRLLQWLIGFYSSSSLYLERSMPKVNPFSWSNSSISTNDFFPKFRNFKSSCVSNFTSSASELILAALRQLYARTERSRSSYDVLSNFLILKICSLTMPSSFPTLSSKWNASTHHLDSASDGPRTKPKTKALLNPWDNSNSSSFWHNIVKQGLMCINSNSSSFWHNIVKQRLMCISVTTF